ncbi:MAG: ABC transporter ATP-binding protein [Myxococcaceae bacterium]
MLLDASHLWKVYGEGDARVEALRDVCLSVEAGEFVAIMGPSGSGKSTLMNLLGCLDKPTRGTYRVEGEDVSQLSATDLAHRRNRTLGFVFQAFNLLPRTSALANVQLPMLYAGVPSKELERRAREALERVGLGDRLSHLPSELSGGQQQRVAIARAIVNRPKVILADEPTGNLDSKTSAQILELFQQLRDEGLTILYVTHEPDVAEYASRLVVVKDGRIAQDGPQTPKQAGPGVAV